MIHSYSMQSQVNILVTQTQGYSDQLSVLGTECISAEVVRFGHPFNILKPNEMDSVNNCLYIFCMFKYVPRE